MLAQPPRAGHEDTRGFRRQLVKPTPGEREATQERRAAEERRALRLPGLGRPLFVGHVLGDGGDGRWSTIEKVVTRPAVPDLRWRLLRSYEIPESTWKGNGHGHGNGSSGSSPKKTRRALGGSCRRQAQPHLFSPPPPKTSPSARAFCRVRSRAAPTMILLLADLAVATATAGGLALLLASLTFASHAWFASVPQRPAAGTSALRGDEDPTGALFAFMLKGYGLALIVTHLHAWCDGPLATQRGQSAAAPMPTRPPTGPTRPRACSRLPSGLASRGLVI